MTAFRLLAWSHPPEFVEVERPHAGPAEVLVKMGAVGLCGSDIHMFHAPPGSLPFNPPFTLGHENAGWVAECGPGVSGLSEGMAVLASSVNSCGRCNMCLQGRDEYCSRSVSMSTRGIGMDGGLGAFAIQYLRQLCTARIIVVDKSPARLDYAKRMGAHDTHLAGAQNVDELRQSTAGRGAEAVLDFVGTDQSMHVAAAVARPLGRIVICGMGAGSLAVAWGKLAPGCQAMLSIGFSLVAPDPPTRARPPRA